MIPSEHITELLEDTEPTQRDTRLELYAFAIDKWVTAMKTWLDSEYADGNIGEALGTRLQEIEADVATHTTEITQNTTDIAEHATEIATHTARLDDVEGNVTTNTADIAELLGVDVAHKVILDDHEARIDTIEEGQITQDAAIESLQNSLADLQTIVEGLL